MINDLVLEPVDKDFDLEAIRSYLDASTTALRDPVDTEQYLMSSDPTVLREGAAKRSTEPKRVNYSLIVLAPTPKRILLAYRSMDTAPAREFVQWLRSRQEIRVLDEEFNDFTKEVDNDLDFLFGPRK